MAFVAGGRVEVIGEEPGLENSFFEGRIARIGINKAMIVYQTLVDDDGAPLREMLPYRRIRPYPANVAVEIQVGDFVDVWDSNGWWIGNVFNHNGGLFTIFFDYMKVGSQFKIYEDRHVRIHQAWRGRRIPRYWIYSRFNTPFYANQRVEVVGREVGLYNSYYAAYVETVNDEIARVVSETLVDDDGNALVEEYLFRRIRPFPPNVNVHLRVDSLVDVWDREGWWKGEIVTVKDNSYEVYFDYMKDGEDVSEYDDVDVRVHQVHQVDEDTTYWSYWVV